MGQLTQENRLLSISDFSLGSDTFIVTSLDASEYISDLFEIRVTVLSSNLDVAPKDLIGKPGSVTVQDDHKRVFSGFVKDLRFGEVKHHDVREYQLTLVPWLWFLSKTSDCRIFQNQNTKDIVSQVFSDLGFKDFQFKAAGGKPREYCVQYNESDLHFVSRLLEEEGISYYFEHSKDKHMLVLVDQANAFKDCAENACTYAKGSNPKAQFHEWTRISEFRKGKWSLTDYNFKEPNKSLYESVNTRSDFANNGKYEHYEYPGFYDFAHGSELVKIRLEAEEAQRILIHGKSNYSSFYAGGKFSLKEHDTASQKDGYVLAAVHHHYQDGSFVAGQSGGQNYVNEVVCVPADVHIRPQPLHKRPVMSGPQSALVVGPSGEEIYIDDLCRIKVQFYWDREGKKDENTTCFIRVMQSWAGNQWGSSFIPRIGHEVIVNFLDGDPDRPIVTGSVYNAWNKPVYPSKTQSGIKTRSTKGGTAQNFNELRFEDKKDSEQIFIHAEKNMDTEVENDETLTVDHDRIKHIKNDETYTIDKNRNKAIGKNQSEDIGENNTISVGKDQTESVGKNYSIDIGDNISINVGKNHDESIGKNMSLSIGGDLSETVKGNYTESVTKDYGLKAKTITLQADDQITLKTGSAQIVMKKNGDITIQGKNINVKGSGNVVLKGSKVSQN